MRVYLSGPMAADPDYINTFADYKKRYKTMGYDVVNPAELGGTIETLNRDEILQIDYKLISMCDGVVMLPNWEKSEGAKQELSCAILQGKKVMLA